MRRGDLMTIALPGDSCKGIMESRVLPLSSRRTCSPPRPRTLLPLTSASQDALLLRVRVDPTPENGLCMSFWVIIDKPATVPDNKIGCLVWRYQRRGDG